MPLVTKILHIVSNGLAPSWLLVMSDNIKCHQTDTNSYPGASRLITKHSQSATINQRARSSPNQKSWRKRLDRNVKVPISPALEKTTKFQTNVASFLQLRPLPRYHIVFSAFQLMWTFPAELRLFGESLQRFLLSRLPRKFKRPSHLYKDRAVLTLWPLINSLFMYITWTISLLATSNSVKWNLNPIALYGYKLWRFIHVWAKSAFLFPGHDWRHIHVSWKSAFLFSYPCLGKVRFSFPWTWLARISMSHHWLGPNPNPNSSPNQDSTPNP